MMVGTKGKSGGARQGAGRKPETMTLRAGNYVTMYTITPDGHTMLEQAEIVVVSRMRLELRKPDGEIIVIIR